MGIMFLKKYVFLRILSILLRINRILTKNVLMSTLARYSNRLTGATVL